MFHLKNMATNWPSLSSAEKCWVTANKEKMKKKKKKKGLSTIKCQLLAAQLSFCMLLIQIMNQFNSSRLRCTPQGIYAVYATV